MASGIGDNDSALTLCDDGTTMPDTEDPWQEHENFQASINGVVQDMMNRLEGGDHNISGVSVFVRAYQKMVKSLPAPSAAIAYALHHFGKADSKHCNNIQNNYFNTVWI